MKAIVFLPSRPLGTEPPSTTNHFIFRIATSTSLPCWLPLFPFPTKQQWVVCPWQATRGIESTPHTSSYSRREMPHIFFSTKYTKLHPCVRLRPIFCRLILRGRKGVCLRSEGAFLVLKKRLSIHDC